MAIGFTFFAFTAVLLMEAEVKVVKSSNILLTVAESTGLPQDLMLKELERLISSAGLNPEQVQLEELRRVLAIYLQDILIEARASLKENSLEK